MANILTDTDLSAVFGIEIDGQGATEAPRDVLCTKCKGRGNFIGYTGRVIGKCFTCAGTGLAATVGVTIKDGDCTKCAGSGEWRPGRPCFACAGTGKEAVATEVSVDAIAQAFAASYQHGIKRPKLRLDTFLFSRAPDHSRNAGSIYVTESGTYLGRVTDGRFLPMPACDDPTKARVVAAAANPHESAKAYGAKTGSCSCCGRELTNRLSIKLGIGPICRDKFGWG